MAIGVFGRESTVVTLNVGSKEEIIKYIYPGHNPTDGAHAKEIEIGYRAKALGVNPDDLVVIVSSVKHLAIPPYPPIV